MLIADHLARPRTRKALYALVLVLALVFLAQTYRKATRAGGYDFTSYLQSAAALASGADPYRTPTVYPYIYPLFLAFALIPLTFMPYGIAVFAWFALGAGCLYRSLRLAARFATTPRGAPLGTGVALLAIVAALDPIQIDLLNGQVNGEVLLLCLLFFFLYEKDRPGAAALSLSAAIAIKIVPLVLILFLAVRRSGRVLVGTLVGALAFCAAPALLVGRRIVPFYADYAREFLLARARASAGTGVDFTPYGWIGRVIPGLAGSAVLRYGTVLLILGAIAYAHRRRCDEAGSAFRFLALHLAAIPLLSPMCEVHHLLFALPGAVLLTVEALEPRAAQSYRSAQVGAALFWCGLWLGRLDRSGPYYFAGLAALVAGLLLGASPETRPPDPSRPAPPPAPA
jgi:alpha-1,2-mannosyltransferase